MVGGVLIPLTARLNSCTAKPPLPSITRTEIVCSPTCSALGCQRKEPDRGSTIIPEGALSKLHSNLSPSASLPVKLY